MQRILFLHYLHTCMFYTLISSPKAYVVVVVSHLLAHAMGETLGAEMKNPVIPVAVGERSV